MINVTVRKSGKQFNSYIWKPKLVSLGVRTYWMMSRPEFLKTLHRGWEDNILKKNVLVNIYIWYVYGYQNMPMDDLIHIISPQGPWGKSSLLPPGAVLDPPADDSPSCPTVAGGGKKFGGQNPGKMRFVEPTTGVPQINFASEASCAEFLVLILDGISKIGVHAISVYWLVKAFD